MVLKLHAHPMSACGRRVATILQEKKVPYELIEADWAAIKTEEWMKNQPFGQMPYIDDDGFILFESRAIGRYISTKYASSGTPLLPGKTDVQTMALLDQAISTELSNFEPYAYGLTAEKIFSQMQGAQPVEAIVKKYEETLTTKMVGFEKILAKQKYMAGNELTFVDLFYCSYGTYLGIMGYDFLTNETKYPNTARWWKEISSRDSWKAVANGIPPKLVE